MGNKDRVEVFYACDDAFIKYLAVSFSSMMRNRDPEREYAIHVLYTTVSEQMKDVLRRLCPEGVTLSFDSVNSYLTQLEGKFPLRDYYSKTTYYRFFISEMFPELDKAIYIDTDTVVRGDISKLYDTELSDFAVGACHEQAMVQVDVYGTYVEKVIGIDRNSFFNAGVMLINCKEFRRLHVLERFAHYLGIYEFKVTQDEDYLNLILKDRVLFLDQRWNTELACRVDYPIEEAYVLHYIMVNKPWHYAECKGSDIFWEEADRTEVAGELRRVLAEYTDEERARDKMSAEGLMALAAAETAKEDKFLDIINKTRDQGRVEIVKKIEGYEREGRFTEDVEDDPPTIPIKPGEVDFLRKKLSSKIKQVYATRLAKAFLKKILKNGQLVIRDIRGAENFSALNTGAVVTCNHFNAFDSFAMHLAYEASGHKKRKLYRVVREGNYTSFPGFYGKLMRNFYTIPLASNHKVMKEFLDATAEILKSGSFLLIYPEQSMWWNYRKPKPLQTGAFSIAAKNGVPILPIFITLRDGVNLGEDGFPIQEYTIHIEQPIYPKADYTYKQNVDYLKNENARVWKQIYESEYGMPLTYTTELDEAAAINQ